MPRMPAFDCGLRLTTRPAHTDRSTDDQAQVGRDGDLKLLLTNLMNIQICCDRILVRWKSSPTTRLGASDLDVRCPDTPCQHACDRSLVVRPRRSNQTTMRPHPRADSASFLIRIQGSGDSAVSSLAPSKWHPPQVTPANAVSERRCPALRRPCGRILVLTLRPAQRPSDSTL